MTSHQTVPEPQPPDPSRATSLLPCEPHHLPTAPSRPRNVPPQLSPPLPLGRKHSGLETPRQKLPGRPSAESWEETRPAPRFCRRPETISVEHLGTSQTCGFLQGWLRSFRSLPSPCGESSFPGFALSAQVILCICLQDGPFPPEQSLGGFSRPVPQSLEARDAAGPSPCLILGCHTESQTSPCLPNSRTARCLPLLHPLVSHPSPVPATRTNSPMCPSFSGPRSPTCLLTGASAHFLLPLHCAGTSAIPPGTNLPS